MDDWVQNLPPEGLRELIAIGLMNADNRMAISFRECRCPRPY
jgi:hypothetical protein